MSLPLPPKRSSPPLPPMIVSLPSPPMHAVGRLAALEKVVARTTAEHVVPEPAERPCRCRRRRRGCRRPNRRPCCRCRTRPRSVRAGVPGQDVVAAETAQLITAAEAVDDIGLLGARSVVPRRRFRRSSWRSRWPRRPAPRERTGARSGRRRMDTIKQMRDASRGITENGMSKTHAFPSHPQRGIAVPAAIRDRAPGRTGRPRRPSACTPASPRGTGGRGRPASSIAPSKQRQNRSPRSDMSPLPACIVSTRDWSPHDSRVGGRATQHFSPVGGEPLDVPRMLSGVRERVVELGSARQRA